MSSRVMKQCLVCGKVFSVDPCEDRKGFGKWCSISCKAVGQRIGPSECIEFTNGKIRVALTMGKFSIVDRVIAPIISSHRWFAVKGANNVYYARTWRKLDGKLATIGMHRLILGANPGQIVDHIDGDGLNNTLDNIRIVTQRQNCQNRHDARTSEFPGVSWDRFRNKWVARRHDGTRYKFLGRFDFEIEAKEAYELADRNSQ